jgi:hypothetical protein
MGATKADEGKVPLSLLPTEALREICKAMQFGVKKYSAHNWRKGMAWSRMHDALLRHVYDWAERKEGDDESGLSHLAHAGFCLLVLLTYEKLGLGEDDRWDPNNP